MSLYEFEWVAGLLDLKKGIDQYPGLEQTLDGVEARIADYLGRDLELASTIVETKTILTPTAHIGLRGIPIVSVSSVIIGGVTWESTAYDITTYGLHLASKTTGIASITYSGGYSSAPEWLKRAITIQATYEWQNKDQMGSETVSNEGGSVTRPALQLLPEVRGTINRHRNPLTAD